MPQKAERINEKRQRKRKWTLMFVGVMQFKIMFIFSDTTPTYQPPLRNNAYRSHGACDTEPCLPAQFYICEIRDASPL
ncbi:hypothetical protein EJ04DRAFT_514237 [Polyplosphaeria fusca]|uniref:Uncharacterized protein n=1 Tax=Polyplosphaeria fusca TaxID=682080 RepID=A0A9P4QT25_9PLEO|nr:hypothetical protein EJ04DRAFT_514237 [Polyplosphaeria fusca]